MNVSDSFGNWLKQQRKTHDWTQAQLAEHTGCSVALIRKYEAGERRPSKQIVGILAVVFEIPMSERETFFAYARGTKPHQVVPYINLPPDQTVFIGRKSERELLRLRLASPECRLLVLSGLGGIGKTRLAIQVGRETQTLFPDGVFLINLVGVDSVEYLVSTIASALGLSFHSLADYKIQLIHFLQARTLLLIMDNYEHLLPRTDLITEILRFAPNAKMIITSRERLKVQEEWWFPVEGLSYPKYKDSDFTDFDTYKLFEQRAVQANSRLILTASDKQSIRRICEVAQGNPLAIELAASWTRMLTCQEIAEAIQVSWNLPSLGLRNIPERHQSIEAVFEYSWNLLSPEERIGFMKLSVFRGGFTEEAVRNVAGVGLPVLANLQDKSFLARNGNGQYEVHELLRRYGETKLDEEPEERTNTEVEFIAYYGKLLNDLGHAMWDSRHLYALAQIKAEIDNIRYAWNLATLSSNWVFFHQSAESVWHYYDDTNLFEEGIAFFQLTIDRLPPPEQNTIQTFALAQLFHAPGWFALRLGRLAEAKTWADKSKALLSTSELHDARKEMFIRGSACFIAVALKNYDEAQHNSQRILAIGQQSGDIRILAASNFFQGIILRAVGDLKMAKSHLDEAVRFFEGFGSAWIGAHVLNELGQLEIIEGNFGSAAINLKKSFDLFCEYGDVGSASNTQVLLGATYRKMGDTAQSAECFYEALNTSIVVHALPVIVEALIEIAFLLVDASELTIAFDILKVVRSYPAVTQTALIRIDNILTKMSETSSSIVLDYEETTVGLQTAIAVALKVENQLRQNEL